MTDPLGPEDLVAAYLAEHAYSSRLDDDDTLAIHVGSLHTPEGDYCLICDTPLTYRQDAGWTHDEGFRQRGGCQIAWPGWPA